MSVLQSNRGDTADEMTDKDEGEKRREQALRQVIENFGAKVYFGAVFINPTRHQECDE